MVDFVKQATDVDKDGDTPAIIKDALMIIKPFKNLRLSFGKFKTPIGMEFGTPGYKLDVVKRGLGQKLVFERNAGAMAQFKNIGESKLGVAAGIFNAGPNAANDVGDPKKGNDYSFVGRVNISPVKNFYAEAFGGLANSSIDSIKSVSILGAAAKFKYDALQLKAEYMLRKDDNNSKADGSDFYIQAGFLIDPHFEPVVKYEKLDVRKNSADQSNLTFGLNYFINPEKRHQSKIQLNYVSSDVGSKSAVQVMFQVAF